MVNGLETFKKHFASYTNQYVLIGGTACSVIMQEAGLSFRATKDLDIVLCIEVLHKSFVKAFWQFILDGGYTNRQYSTSKEIFYRFSSPNNHTYPVMLELFSRIPDNVNLAKHGHLTPIPINDAVASLSAILLDNEYYQFVHSGKLKINDLSVLSASHLIPIKAKAYIDLSERKSQGEHIDERNIRKHRNDIIRLFQLLSPTSRIRLPSAIQKDFQIFLEDIKNLPLFDCTNFGLKNINIHQIIELLETIYLKDKFI